MKGLALEGGGAKGAYQIGAYKALIDCNYKFKMIAGTSIGSVNAALIVQGDFAHLEQLWKEIDSKIFGMDPEIVSSLVHKKIDKKCIKNSFSTFVSILKNRGIDTSEFLALLTKYIDEDRVRKSKVKFGLVTMRLSDLKPLELSIDEIPEGKLIEYIMASCYLPVFHMKKIIDDNYYIDGGFTNVLPITLLEKHGCDEIIGVRVKKFGLIKKPKNKDTKVTIIKPRKNIGSIILIDKDRTISNSSLGYYDTMKTIKNLDGNIFYFKRKNLRFYRYIARGIKKSEKQKLMKKYHAKDLKTLIIRLLEYTMEYNNYNVYEIYDPWKIIRKLKRGYTMQDDSGAFDVIIQLKNY